MATLRNHRVIIASLFLPLTAAIVDEPDQIQPPASPLPAPIAKAARAPLKSIVDDLATKSKLTTPVTTPSKESANPFVSFSSISTALGQAGAAVSTVAATVQETAAAVVQPLARAPSQSHPAPRRLARLGSRPSSRRPSVAPHEVTPGASASIAPWVLEPNPHGNGGLYNAVRSVEPGMRGKLWVGVLGTPTDGFDKDLRAAMDRRLAQQDCLNVWVADAEFSGCYDVFCHQVLWPTLHYAVPDAPRTKNFYESSSFEQYESVNQKFADAIVSAYRPGDIIWVHDYHLMLVPAMVRAKLPKAILGFFQHVAWPSSEIMRCLAVREKLIRGVLGADLVGSQTHNFARHFRNCASRVLSLETVPKGILTGNGFVDVAVFPMGIDVGRLNRKRQEPEVAEWCATLRQRYADMKIIVGRDKLDEVQGVRQKIMAFEAFLLAHPEYQGKVVLIQVALFTTEENETQGRVSEVVSRVNSRFSTLTHQPIVFLHTQDLTFSQYLALLTVADVFMVASLREGMALRAHEFVACQEGAARPAPLILSEFTGSYTFSGFRSCIPCNPWDTRQTSAAIYQALTMPDEEAVSRWKDLYSHVTTQTAQAFVTTFLTRCVRVHTEHQQRPLSSIPVLSPSTLVPAYAEATQRLLVLDLEATLWARDPRTRGVPAPPALVSTLRRLVRDKRNAVWLLSGLSKASLESALGPVAREVGLCAENGCFIRSAGPNEQWSSMIADFDLSWMASAKEILNYFTERTAGSFVTDRDASIVWRFWTGNPDESMERQWARRQAAEAQNHIYDSLGERYNLRIIPADNSFLVLPNNVSRSSAVGAILRLHGASGSDVASPGAELLSPQLREYSPIEFLLAISQDDKLLGRLADLPNTETCSTSGKASDAKWKLSGVDQVLAVLQAFTESK